MRSKYYFQGRYRLDTMEDHDDMMERNRDRELMHNIQTKIDNERRAKELHSDVKLSEGCGCAECPPSASNSTNKTKQV